VTRDTLKTRVMFVSAAMATLTAVTAGADVTVEQKTTFDLSSLIHANGGMTTSISGDKKREDSETHCDGMMSIVCGNLQGGEIVRLDRDLTWRLQPKKKTYREEPFATPEQIAQMRAKMKATLEKLQSCPVSQTQQPVDKSKCVMSTPKIDVHKTGDKLAIAGHDAERSNATLTESCTNSDTGSVCDTVVVLDVWLTQDNVHGAEDRKASAMAYAKKLGLDDPQGAMRGDFAKYLAPYQSQIKQITDKSSDLKGQPLKTSLRVLMGGAQCKEMTKTDGSKAEASDAGSASPVPNPLAGAQQAGKAIGSLVGGLFGKKKTPDSQAPAAPTAADAAVDPYAQYIQLVRFNIETTAINADAIPANRFEIPPDWKKEEPKPAKAGGDEEVQCPKTGS
jgi:hypothetical protein